MKREFSADIEKFKSRILFGTDWHVLRRMLGYREFLHNYERVLREVEVFSNSDLDLFRGDNALEFLGLRAEGRQSQTSRSPVPKPWHRRARLVPAGRPGDGTGDQSTSGPAAYLGDGGSLRSRLGSRGREFNSQPFVKRGVYANNPSMYALAQTQDQRYFKEPDTSPKISEIVLLSLGTGTSLFHIKRKNLDWGYAQWIKPLISLMLDGISGIAHYQCKQILRDRYHRLAPVFPSDVSIPMDAIKKMPYMVEFADEIKLKKTIDWMKANWMTD